MCCSSIDMLTDTLFYREVGTIIRSLGCCPSEAELRDMLAEVSDLCLL